jgi:hypothetical protein
MHHDKVGLVNRLVDELCYRPQNERIADPMESILAQTIRLGNLLVDRVRAHRFRDCLVKRGVKECNASNFGKLFSAKADYLQC